MMRVLIVNDHPLVAAGFMAGLTANGQTASVAHSVAEAGEMLHAEDYDLCILDINLPDGPGTNLLSDRSLSERLPPLCLLLSGTSDRDEILMALHAGASAFISKSVEFSDLMKAINLLIDLPESPREPLYWDQINNKFVRVAEAFPKGTVLSPREREVFALMRQGMQDKKIAFALERSIHTIRVQIRSIRRKRGVTRRGEANQCQ